MVDSDEHGRKNGSLWKAALPLSNRRPSSSKKIDLFLFLDGLVNQTHVCHQVAFQNIEFIREFAGTRDSHTRTFGKRVP